jgi:fatty acid elongase 3
MLADLILSQIPASVAHSVPHNLLRFTPGETPLSTTPVVVTALAGYLATIFSIQYAMADRKPFKVTWLFQLHNVLLTTGSALVRFQFRCKIEFLLLVGVANFNLLTMQLLLLMLEEIAPIWFDDGLSAAMCAPKAWTPVR